MSKVIHQAFHGYNNGHKLLSSSVELPAKTKSILLRESDSPGEEFHYQSKPCYSGYPIRESGFYVVSKTWVAQEISRPGCVWTHSLLIPFTILATREGVNLIDLESLFSLREKIEDYQSLSPIDLTFSPILSTEKNLSPLFSKVFTSDEQVILSSDDVSFIDIISIWGKLWPKMRREFSFKTWAPKKTRSSLNFEKFDLVLSDFALLRDSTENWAEDFFLKDSSIHDFNWKYGASLTGGKGGVFELYKAWVLYSNNRQDELVDYLLRWKKAPVSLVKDVITKLPKNKLTLSLSYLISKYILTLEKSDVSDDFIAKVGDMISRNDRNFFKKVIESDFYFKECFYSLGIKNLQGSDIAELINSNYIDLKLINDKNILNDESFWKSLSEPYHLDLINGYDSFNDVPLEVIKKIFHGFDKLQLDDELSTYVIMSNFNIDRHSHKEKITTSKNKVLKIINNGFAHSSISLYDFIFETYSASELTFLSDDSLCELYNRSSEKYINVIRLIEVLCCDEETPRKRTLDVVFEKTDDKLSSYDLGYLEMSKARELFGGYLGLEHIIPRSLSDLLVAFTKKYSLKHNVELSQNILEKVNSHDLKRKGKKNYNIFWFLDL
ncbi:hypothetical protein [Vibrio parahaemolyticus]|uniref:GAP1-N1 domain-containing protein n=1 Tax=Vibrio parahaemolyticus TaxID=670 RepID=UPI002492D069|nr:hypothetical protein [Vibrio parahaemolyticus]